MQSLIAILILLFAIPAPASAQGGKKKDAEPTKALVKEAEEDAPDLIYSWVDGRGGWHFVDQLELVPRRYRAQAKANATRATKIAPNPEVSTLAAPPAPPKREPIHTPATERDMTAGERTMRVRQLQRRLGELQSEIAVLEEGSVPNSYLEEAGGEEALTNEKLEELLSRTEQEISEIEAEIATLKDE